MISLKANRLSLLVAVCTYVVCLLSLHAHSTVEEIAAIVGSIPIADSPSELAKEEEFILAHMNRDSVPLLLDLLSTPTHAKVWPNAFLALGLLCSVDGSACAAEELISVIEGAQNQKGLDKLALTYCGYVALARLGGDQSHDYLAKKCKLRAWQGNESSSINTTSERNAALLYVETSINAIAFHPSTEKTESLFRELRSMPEYDNDRLRSQLEWASRTTRDEHLARERRVRTAARLDTWSTLSQPDGSNSVATRSASEDQRDTNANQHPDLSGQETVRTRIQWALVCSPLIPIIGFIGWLAYRKRRKRKSEVSP